MRKLMWLLLLVLASGSAWGQEEAVVPFPELHLEAPALEEGRFDVEALMREAVRQNPEIRAARRAWEAAAARAPQAAPPDPAITIQYADVPGFANPRFIGDGMAQVAIAQRVLGRGKIPAQKAVALHEAASRREIYREKILQLETDVRRLVDDLYLIDIEIAVHRKHKQLMEHFVEIARIQYTVGKGAQPDVLKAQAEQTRIANELVGLARRRQQVEARLNRRLSRPQGGSFGQVPPPAEPPSEVDPALLRERARTHRPILVAASEQIEKARSGVDLADAQDNPDVTFSLMGRWFNGRPDSYLLSATIPLPFFNQERYRSIEIEAEAMVDKMQAEYELILDDIDFKIEDKLAAMRQGVEQAHIVESTLLPQVNQTLRAAVSNYQTGRVDFLTLIDAENKVLLIELSYYRFAVKAHQALIDLEGAVGQRMEEWTPGNPWELVLPPPASPQPLPEYPPAEEVRHD